MKHLLILKNQTTGWLWCMIDEHPEALSDFRDGGDPVDVVLKVPVDVALASPEMAAALRRAHASMVLGAVAEVGSPIEKECRAALKKAGVDL